MDHTTRPPNEQTRSARAPAPQSARPAPAAQSPDRARAASAPVQHKPAAPASRTQQPQVAQGEPGSSPERLMIAPPTSETPADSIEFDSDPVVLGTNRSYACVVTVQSGQHVSVSLVPGMYR